MGYKTQLFDFTSRSMYLVGLTAITGIIISMGVIFDSSYAAPYSNYTSEKYQIQFQYPGDWQVIEKKSRFDEGVDIQLNSPTISGGFILMQYLNKSSFQGKDFRSSVYSIFKDSITTDYSNEYKVIEQPSFGAIDNQQSGTFLYTRKDKYEDNALRWADQRWLVETPDNGYLISFSSTPDVFDSPTTTEVRDHFIKSINFLGIANSTQSDQPSRFE